MSLRVLNDNILIKPYKEETKSSGGIIVSLDDKKKESRGVVAGCGTNVTQVELKDEVLYARYAGTDLTVDGIDYVVVKESDILVVVAPKKKG